MHRAPPHEPPRHAFGRRIDDVDRFGPVEQALRPRRHAAGARLAGSTSCQRRPPPARPLGQMALARLRPPHPLGPELDPQPVDQPRHLALARRLLDQAVLRRAEASVQSAVKREGVEAELRDRAPPPCRRAAAGDASARGWGSRSRPTATATLPSTRIAGQRQPPRAEMPLLAAARRARGSAARAPGRRLRDASPALPA